MTVRPVSLFFSLLICSALHAQTPAQSLYLEKNPQLNCGFAAALADFKSGSISTAEASYAEDNGKFVGIDGSSDSWTAGIGADSYTRISDRIVFYGRLSYSYFTGKNMSGSVLRDMYYNPVAFLESGFDNSGIKTQELYSLQGAASYSFSNTLSAGFDFSYESGNSVKTKDPRYRSEWMNMCLSASTWYRPSSGFAVGGALFWRNTQEMVKSHIYGTTEKQYYLAIDRGAFLGTYETVEGSSGFVSTSDLQPMTNNFWGGRAMIESGTYRGVLEANYRKGKYGFGSSSAPIYCKFGGPEAYHSSRVIIDSGDCLHDIWFNASYKMIKNTENSFKYSTSAGSNTVVNYSGSNKVLTRHSIAASLGYKGSCGISEGKPSMQFGASADMNARLQKSTVYPYVRKQTVISPSVNGFFDKYIYTGKSSFLVGASVFGGAGFGSAAKDSQLATVTAGTIKSFDALLNRQFEYETAPFAGAGINFKYYFSVRSKYSAYIGLQDNFSALLKEPQYLPGRTRNCALLTLGLNF